MKYSKNAMLFVSACSICAMISVPSFAAETAEAPVLTVESNLYGEADTHGYSTLKAEEGVDVEYDAETAAVLTLAFEDGTEIDDSKIDTSNAYVALEEGDAYYVSNLIFSGTELDGTWENGQLSYHLEAGDITWNNYDYPVDNGGVEWSAIGGDGNGHYVFNLSVNGIQYDGVEVAPATFRAEVYIYGREFSSRKSPNGDVKPVEEQGNGAAGYDDLVLPEASEAALEEKPEVTDAPVWTWVGEGEKPILCDYETDNFYVSWPEGVDASALTNGDVQITMYSQYGDEYVMTPEEEYTVYASADETQISVNMVYWPFAPVYNTMELTVDAANVEGAEESTSQTYDIASVYTHMVQTGGGYDRVGTVTCRNLFGVENLESLDQVFSPSTYFYGYRSPDAERNDPYELFLAEDENGELYVTANEEEATHYDADVPGDANTVLCDNIVFTTNASGTLDMTYEDTEYTFSKVYEGGKLLAPAEELTAAPGYILTKGSWDDQQRWAWLFINGLGWMEEEAAEE